MTNDQRMENLYWLEASKDEVVEEGANWDVRKEFVKYRKQLKKSCKEVEKAYRKKDFSTAKKKIKETKKLIDMMYNDFSRLQTSAGIGSWIFGWINANVMFIGRTLVSSLFGPLAQTIVSFSIIVKRINTIINDARKDNRDIDINDFNLYINGIKVRLNEYKDQLNKFEELIAEEEAATKRNSKD